jgi:hypothetical protein
VKKNEMQVERGRRLQEEEDRVRIVRVFNFWSLA